MTTPPPQSLTPSPQPPIITLTTDFGLADTFVAQMKGAIAGISPGTRVIDSTHEVPAGNILSGAVALDSLVDAFPNGTIHVAVIDPGVGSGRAAVAVNTERFTLIGPDNGLFTLVLERYPPTAIVNLNDPAWHNPPVSPTFHGRDIFAPASAHLAYGTPINKLGEPTSTLVNLNIPQVEETPEGLTALVLSTDRFGNLITNLTRNQYDSWLVGTGCAGAVIGVKKRVVGPIKQTFADVNPGDPVAYFGSSGRLELAICNGSAWGELTKAIRQRVQIKPV